MLGDASEFAQSVMLRMYTSDDLKSDAVQTGHHGYNNLTSLYNAIKAPFIMYSNSEANAGLNSGNREKYLGAVNAAPDPVVVFSDPDTVKITVEDGEISYSYLPSYREGLYFDIPELAESLVPDSNEPAVDINEVLENNNFIDKVIDKSINGTLSESVNEPCSRALDGKTDTKFCTKTVPATIAWSMKEPVKVSHYVVYSANDNSKNPGRNPEKWVLCGSNDKENWTIIDAVSSANMPDTDFTGVAFDVDSPAEYQYYVFKVFSTAGAEVLQYSEIALYGDVNLAGFAKAVDEQIAALGEITLEKKEQVEAARTAYEALDEQTKAMVIKLDVLVAAEEAIVDLTAAAEVEKMISELGEITSLDQKDAVEAARAAFDKLTEAQQELVKNENVLKDAELSLIHISEPTRP